MEKNLSVKRTIIPPEILEWLEADQKKTGVLIYREENDQVILERLENIDPSTLGRVRANIQRYHSALQRLADV